MSNEELFKQALVEGVSRHFDKTIEEAKKNEQIEEIAKYLCKSYSPYCSMCPDCYAEEEATALYNAGYRKQSENTVKVVRCKDCKYNVANMDKDPLDITDYSGDDIVCSYFMTDGLEPTDFCSYGAKMKGGE